MARWDTFTWLIEHTYSDAGHKYEIFLKITLAQSEQQAKYHLKKKKKSVNSRLLGGMLPQLQMDLSG